MAARENGTETGLLTYADLVGRVMRDLEAEMERRKWNRITREVVGELVLGVLHDNGDPFAEIGDPFGPPGDLEGQAG